MQKGVEIETGLCDFEALDSEHCLFEGLGKTFPVRSHHWASLTSVPEGFTHLGRTLPGPNSTGCEVAMMESTDGRIVSTQFHPELIDTGLVIMENFLRPRHQP
jgi:GMP synthase-like glutamine amidotransferase